MPNELTNEVMEVWRKQRIKDHEQADRESEEAQRDRVRRLHILGLLRPDMTGLEILLMAPSESLEQLQAMSPKQRAAVRQFRLAAAPRPCSK
jgi:hypothetical protein